MIKGSSNILTNGFFEDGGISKNAFFIFFIVLLLIIQIGIYFKGEETIIQIRNADKEIFNLGMKSMSSQINLMDWYKRSVIEIKVEDRGLISADKLPYVLEKD